MFGKIVYAFILQSHAVKHPTCGFGHARIVVALSRHEGCPFDDKASEAVEVDEVGKLKAVAECSGGGEHRIFESKRSNLNGSLYHCLIPRLVR